MVNAAIDNRLQGRTPTTALASAASGTTPRTPISLKSILKNAKNRKGE